MQAYEEDEAPLSEGEYEEGLDDEYEDEYEDDDGELEEEGEEEEGDEEGEGYVRGLEPLPGQAGGRSTSLQAAGAPRPWKGLESLPAATRATFVQLLNKFRAQDKQELTVLVLGKHCVGKTFTVNSLLAEEAGPRTFLNRDTAAPAVHAREAHGFTIRVIDPPGLTDADMVSAKRLAEAAALVQGRPLDVLLYVDRLDTFRTQGPDAQVFGAIGEALGPGVWAHAVICLTHAGTRVSGYAWEDFAARRAEQVLLAARRHGGAGGRDLPVAFIENGPECETNEGGERVLPDGSAWLPALMEKITSVATGRPAYVLDSAAVKRAADPNRRLRWLVPVIFAAQVALKALVFDRLVKDDFITGDRHGPFDPAVVRAERARIRLEKEGRAAKGKRRPLPRASAFEDSDSD